MVRDRVVTRPERPTRGATAFHVDLDRLRDAALVLDEHGRIVDANAAARQLAQRTHATMVGLPVAEVFAEWRELVDLCASQREPDEVVIARRGGAPRHFAVRRLALAPSGGPSAGSAVLITLRDVSERIEAEQALKDREERFSSIFAEVPVGIAVIDLDGHLLQVNKAFSEMLEYREDELIGQNLLALTHPDDVGADMLLAGKSLSGEIVTYKVEKRYIKKSHETLWADLTATILRNQSGEPLYGLVMIENIIERKRAKLLEEERYHVAYELHDGLAQVAVSVHQHLQALASHYHPRSPQARRELEQALDLAQRSVREARRLIGGLRPTILDDFGLAMALRLQVEALQNDGWDLVFEEAIGQQRLPPKIETTLFGVAQESLTNVRKHSGTTRARLAVERQDMTIHLRVQDWGCGFEPRTLFKVYRPGEHLGIRAMQERVELVGGHLHVTSQAGMGTLVVAEVPVQPSGGGEPPDAAEAVRSEATSLLLRDHLAERSAYDGY
jgi:PAS domain S-box-containing protein